MSNKQPTNIKTINLLRSNQAAGSVGMKDGRKLIAPQTSQSFGGGKLAFVVADRPNRSPEALAKRLRFFEARIAARKDPANCGKCGKPRDREGRMCVRCLNTQRRRVARNKGHALIAGDAYTVEKLAGMVLQMRKEMDKLQVRFKLWQKAANYRRNLHYRTNTLRKKYFKQFSRNEALDYLSGSNHAYEPKED